MKASILVLLSDVKEHSEQPPCPPSSCLKRSREASCSEDVVKLCEDELHRLVLVDHVHGYVAVVPLWPHKSRPEHNADVLRGHSVGI